jgi:hypothetical protein
MFYSSRKETAQAPILQDAERLAVPSKFEGIYRGVVENNSDPLAQGRVQVRVPTIHGVLEKGEPSPENLFIPSEYLPWAHVISFGGSSYDSGSQLPIPTGSQVVVEFESGNPNMPIVLGCIHFHPTTKISDQKDPLNEWPVYNPAAGPGSKQTPAPTVPREYAITHKLSPTRGVLLKSRKGHTIWYDDRDEGECFEMADRVGQGLRMEAYVGVADNKENKSRRGSLSSWAYSTDIDEEGKSSINAMMNRVSLREKNGNEISLESGTSVSHARMLSGSCSVQAQGSTKRTIFGSVKAGMHIEVDEEAGSISIKAPVIMLDGEVYFSKLASFFGEAHFFNRLYSFHIANFAKTNIPNAAATQEV